jgi:hypothetical protein
MRKKIRLVPGQRFYPPPPFSRLCCWQCGRGGLAVSPPDHRTEVRVGRSSIANSDNNPKATSSPRSAAAKRLVDWRYCLDAQSDEENVSTPRAAIPGPSTPSVQTEDAQLTEIWSHLALMRAEAHADPQTRGATPALTAVKHGLHDWIQERLASLIEIGTWSSPIARCAAQTCFAAVKARCAGSMRRKDHRREARGQAPKYL